MMHAEGIHRSKRTSGRREYSNGIEKQQALLEELQCIIALQGCAGARTGEAEIS
jgi:hypothetical protein